MELLQPSSETTSYGLPTVILYLAGFAIVLLFLVFVSIRRKEIEISLGNNETNDFENNEINDSNEPQNIGLLERARAKS